MVIIARQKDVIELKPNKKQEEFFTSDCKYTGYGGAKAGGKSWALRNKLVLLCMNYPGIQCLLIRKTLKDLHKNHELPLIKLLRTETKTKRIAYHKKQDKEFHFPNGAILHLGYAANDDDLQQYAGQAYDVIGVEEATQFTETQLRFFPEINRRSPSMQGKFDPRMYFTFNPGGPGHSYIKRLFIDRDFNEKENPKDYKFIQALVYDNDHIMKNDPGYVKALERLPEDRKRAMLYGDWDVFTGQLFPEFRREKHVIKPFDIPKHWKRFRALDYGLDMTAGLWFAVDEDGFMYVYKEFNQKDLIVSHAAEAIVSNTDVTEPIAYTVIPPDVSRKRQQQTGETTMEIMIRHGLTGIVEADNSRVQGWRNIRELLEMRTNRFGDEQPRLQIFDTCKMLIKHFPLLQASEKNPEDAAKEPHEITHNMDALRYGIMSRPGSASAPEKELKYPEFEDFDDFAGIGDGFY